MHINEQQRLLNCKMAATYLGMTVPALRKNIYLRRFKKTLVKIGGRIFFDKVKLDRFIEDSALEEGKNKK